MPPLLRPLFLSGIGLIFLLAIAQAEEPVFDFGLTGRITITKATMYMDGGSISVNLQDEHGNTALTGYRNVWRHDGGKFTFRNPGAATYTEFLPGSGNGRALLKLIQAACVATYKTDDPQQLNASKDWNQFAMAHSLERLNPSAKAKAPPAPGAKR